jgi:hypothetical protein
LAGDDLKSPAEAFVTDLVRADCLRRRTASLGVGAKILVGAKTLALAEGIGNRRSTIGAEFPAAVEPLALP